MKCAHFFCKIDIKLYSGWLHVWSCPVLHPNYRPATSVYDFTYIIMYIHIAEHYCVYRPTGHMEYLPLTGLVAFFSSSAAS